MVGSQSTSVNLGANGTSLTNLLSSSSDLSKYAPGAIGTAAASITYGTQNAPRSLEELLTF